MSSSPVPHPAPAPGAVKEPPKLSGIQKAAALMVILGEETSVSVLRELDEEEVHKIGREIAGFQNITSEVAETVLSEFYEMLLAQQYVLKGGMDYARKLLVAAFGAEHARRLLDKVTKSLGSDGANFWALQKADPQQLANFIHGEHPQTIALILSHLATKQAANLLSSLPEETRADVAMRMANLDQISPEIISKIANVIGQKLKSLGETSREAYGGVRAVAEMFNRLGPDDSRDILEKIETEDPRLGETIRQLMFVFEDLVRIDRAGIRELLARVDRKVLTVALKGASDPVREHLLSAMSQRGAEMLREDLESLGQIKMKEVETARQQVIAAVRLLENEGIVNLGDSGTDQYVS